MPMRRMIALTSALAASTTLLAVSPASAQVYFRPYGGVYVERYYEPAPMYAPPPVYAPRAGMPPQDVEPMLRSMGMRAVGRVRADGGTYVVDATDAGGMRQRVRIDVGSGQIIAMRPLGPVAGPAPVTAPPTASTGNAGRRYATPEQAGPPNFPPPPLPPTRPPELAAVPAPAPIVPDEPAAASSPAAPPPVAPNEAAKPADAPAPAVSQSPASQPGAVRVIPGVAVPPGTAPAPAKAGVGTGTGTGTGDNGSAGTASVVAKENPPATLAP